MQIECAAVLEKCRSHAGLRLTFTLTNNTCNLLRAGTVHTQHQQSYIKLHFCNTLLKTNLTTDIDIKLATCCDTELAATCGSVATTSIESDSDTLSAVYCLRQHQLHGRGGAVSSTVQLPVIANHKHEVSLNVAKTFRVAHAVTRTIHHFF